MLNINPIEKSRPTPKSKGIELRGKLNPTNNTMTLNSFIQSKLGSN